ncbi:EthD family reductase [Leucobacter allii]|uniref:EthD family reductase n=1 Tax=Leucobacter allii TaxID=2932247 RepID=A0ABY4FH45_9MICO|nr:EthD family reductase [Leucobacter allii]UOQ55971.1 EthD family reductase [Leucobacter allii]
MDKLIVLYPEPEDRQAFEAYYRGTHLPLCAQLPGVLDISFSIGLENAPYFALFEATFADRASLESALASPEGRAVEADVPNYASGGATVFTATDESLPLP